MASKKQIAKRLDKTCAICVGEIKLILYTDKAYRGGHYFGKIPFHTKKELRAAMKFGTVTEKINRREIEVMRKDPKPYKYVEYWECPKCYWK